MLGGRRGREGWVAEPLTQLGTVWHSITSMKNICLCRFSPWPETSSSALFRKAGNCQAACRCATVACDTSAIATVRCNAWVALAPRVAITRVSQSSLARGPRSQLPHGPHVLAGVVPIQQPPNWDYITRLAASYKPYSESSFVLLLSFLTYIHSGA